MGIHGNQKELHGNRWKSEEIRRTKSMQIWRNRLGKYIYVPLWRGQYWHHWATYLLCRTDSASSLSSAWSRTQAKGLKIGLQVIHQAGARIVACYMVCLWIKPSQVLEQKCMSIQDGKNPELERDNENAWRAQKSMSVSIHYMKFGWKLLICRNWIKHCENPLTCLQTVWNPEELQAS